MVCADHLTLMIQAVNQYFAGTVNNATASWEVILSAGSVGTPHILLNSGIGNKTEVEAAGVESLVDLPGVGTNLQDHLYTTNLWSVNDNQTFDQYWNNEAFQEELLSAWKDGGDSQFLVDAPTTHVEFGRLPNDHPALQAVAEDPSSGHNSPHFELAFQVRAVLYRVAELPLIKLFT